MGPTKYLPGAEDFAELGLRSEERHNPAITQDKRVASLQKGGR